jgi:hypothetical protein
MSLGLLAAIAPAVPATIMTAVGVVLFVLSPRETAPPGLRAEDAYPFIAIPLSLCTVGAAIAWRHPRNPIGWLLSTGGVFAALVYLAGAYATYGTLGESRLPYADVAAWVFAWGRTGMAIWIPPVVFLFPDGHLRSRLDRVGLLIGLSTLVLGAVGLALYPGRFMAIAFVENPFGWQQGAAILDAALAAIGVLALSAVYLGIKSVRARYRSASALERQQLKWLAAGALLYVVTTAVILPPYFAAWIGLPVDPLLVYLANLFGGLAYTIMPITIGVAILRYRLYEIDVVIRRTLVYGAVSVVLAGTYLAAVIVLQAALRSLTSGSELAVAGSTLLVVALFQPLRSRIQGTVDRRFYRSRYDAARTLDAFGLRLRDEVDVDASVASSSASCATRWSHRRRACG